MRSFDFLKQIKANISKEAVLERFRNAPTVNPKQPYNPSIPPITKNKPAPMAQPLPPQPAMNQPAPAAHSKAAPLVQDKGAVPAPAKAQLTPGQTTLAKMFRMQFDKMLDLVPPDEKLDLDLHSFIVDFTSKARNGIIKNIAKHMQPDYLAALDSVVQEKEEENAPGMNENEAKQVLKDAYLKMLGDATEDQEGRPDVQQVNNDFMNQYGSDPRFKQYVRSVMEEFSHKALPGEVAPVFKDMTKNQGYENLDLQQVMGLIQMNGIEKIRKWGDFMRNPHNEDMLQQAVKTIVDAPGINRKGLSDAFLQSYLGLGAAGGAQSTDPATIQRFFKLLMKNKGDVSNLNEGNIDRRLQQTGTGGMDDRLANSDVIKFIQEVLFMPDTYGKESVGKFMLDPTNKQLKQLEQIMTSNGATPEDLDDLKNGMKVGINTRDNHEVLRPYYKAISDYVTTLINAKDDTFFNWVTKQAYRDFQSGINSITRQAPRTKGENGDETSFDFADEREGLADDDIGGFDDGVDPDDLEKDRFSEYNELDQEPDEGFGEVAVDEEEQERQRTQNLLSQEGLAADTDIIPYGEGAVRPEQLRGFFENYKKIRGCFEGVSRGIDAACEASTDPQQKMDLLSKKGLYSLYFQVADRRMNNLFVNAKQGLRVGDTRIHSLINQDWSQLVFFDEVMQHADRSMKNPVVKDIVEQAYQQIHGQNADQTAANETMQQLHTQLFTMPKTFTGAWLRLNSFQNILLSPEVVDNYGKEALISLIDFIGIEPRNIRLGALLSKSNSQAVVEEKYEYLTDLARRGSLPNMTEEQIENMTPEELNGVFEQVRGSLMAFYGPKENRIKLIVDNPYITDQDIAAIGSASGVSSKQDLIKAKPAVQKSVLDSLYNPQFFKKIQLHAQQEPALVYFMAKEMFRQYGGRDIEFANFLTQIGLQNANLTQLTKDPKAIEKMLEDFPVRRLHQLASNYFPDIYRVFRAGKLNKTRSVKDEATGKIRTVLTTPEDITAIMQNIEAHENAPQEEIGLPSTGHLPEALVFAKILDLPDHAQNQQARVAAATASLRNLRKLSMIRKMNGLRLLKHKFAQRNVDTYFIDMIIDGLENGGR